MVSDSDRICAARLGRHPQVRRQVAQGSLAPPAARIEFKQYNGRPGPTQAPHHLHKSNSIRWRTTTAGSAFHLAAANLRCSLWTSTSQMWAA